MLPCFKFCIPFFPLFIIVQEQFMLKQYFSNPLKMTIINIHRDIIYFRNWLFAGTPPAFKNFISGTPSFFKNLFTKQFHHSHYSPQFPNFQKMHHSPKL